MACIIAAATQHAVAPRRAKVEASRRRKKHETKQNEGVSMGSIAMTSPQ